MSISTKVTAFTWNEADPAGTNYDVSLPFIPTFMILFTSGNASATDAIGRDGTANGVGFAVSGTQRASAIYGSADASGTAFLGIRHSDVAVMCYPTSIGGDGGSLDLLASGSWTNATTPRFTVDLQLLTGAGNLRIGVLAIGGADIAEANVVTFQEPGATGAQTVAHGLSGTPTGALFSSIGYLAAPPAGQVIQGMYSLGASDGTNNAVLYVGADDGNTTMDTRSYCLSGECIALGTEPAVTTTAHASVTSFDGTNINLNWTERASTRYVFGLVWRGGSFKVSSVTTATNTTQFNGPTNGFIPKAAMFLSAARAASASDTPTDHSHVSVGAATGASERIALASLDEDGVGTSECTTAIETDEVYININTSSAVQGLMDVVDMTVDPMQLVMDDADPSGSFVGVLSWGDTPAAASAFPHQYYAAQRTA